MTRSQRTRIVNRVGFFIISFSLLMVFFPYVLVALALYAAFIIAMKVK